MNYAVIHVSNGNFIIHSEHGSNLVGAKVSYHNLCAALENDKGKINSHVRLVDESLNTVDGKYEDFIQHDAR